MSFAEILAQSVPENFYIFICAVLSLVSGGLSFYFAHVVSTKFDSANETKLKKSNYYVLDVMYTVFVTLISIFPLLGMLGTVIALLSLDLSAETEAVKGNFFYALTSTAWGIIFAIIFKIANSCIQPFVENQITKAKKILKTQEEQDEQT